MNPPSDTPRVDAQMESPREATVPIEFARTLERELNAAVRGCDANHAVAQLLQQQIDGLQDQLSILKSKREAAVRYGADSLESDSIENSCNCLAKITEHQFHKPGCKYRLISERDAARQECENFRLETVELVMDLKCEQNVSEKLRVAFEAEGAKCERLQGILNFLPDKLAQRLENLWAALGWNFEVLSVAQKAMLDEIKEALTNK